MLLSAGQKAPFFTLPDKDGNIVSIADSLGKKTILCFYPRDNSPGCIRQACAIANQYDEIKARGAEILCINKDCQSSHRRFAEKYSLPQTLLSNPIMDVIKAYGVWQQKRLYGQVAYGIVRTTYIIDEKGYIEHVFTKVKPDKSAQDIIDYLDGKKQ